jgi:hypothetical protein
MEELRCLARFQARALPPQQGEEVVRADGVLHDRPLCS